jgi:signal peptidase II
MDVTEENKTETVGKRRNASFAIWMTVAGLVVVLDQLTKLAILKWVPLYSRIPVNYFLNITHQENRGAAFSFLADQSGWQRWFFSALAIAVSVYLVRWLWTLRMEGHRVLSAGLALVLGGALGNVIDRIRLGHVVDFIQVMFGTWPFPSFNVADSAISVGAALLIVDMLFLSRGGERKAVADYSAAT